MRSSRRAHRCGHRRAACGLEEMECDFGGVLYTDGCPYWVFGGLGLGRIIGGWEMKMMKRVGDHENQMDFGYNSG